MGAQEIKICKKKKMILHGEIRLRNEYLMNEQTACLHPVTVGA